MVSSSSSPQPLSTSYYHPCPTMVSLATALTTDNLALDEEASSIKREFPRGCLALASIHKKVKLESIWSSHKASWALVMVVYTTLYSGGLPSVTVEKKRQVSTVPFYRWANQDLRMLSDWSKATHC